MFAEGVTIGIGLLMIMAKMSVKWKLRLLSNPVIVDICVFIFLCILHGGSGQALVIAGIGAATVSGALSIGRKLYGYNDKKTGKYVRGFFNLGAK
jgi:hypothetical protein